MTATIPPPRPTAARVADAKVASMFTERWSRRALSPRPLAADVVHSLFEAARWAPSASNSQPWIFIYGDDEETLASLHPVLNDKNQRWARRAPLLMLLFARKNDDRGRALRNAQFDAGSAWMSLALQAHALGLTAHAMAGFHPELAYRATGVPEEHYEVMAAIAVAYPGDAAELPEDLLAREQPSVRKPASEFAQRGRYRAP